MTPLILIILLITIIYYYLKKKYQYWEKRGISGPKPSLLVGNMGKALIFKTSPGQIYTDIYNKYENEEVVGVYRTTTPVLLIRDPELIKEVTVKSFSHFHDNDFYINKEDDPLFGRNVFVLKGDEWKVVRGQLTPGFSSAKMRQVYPILEESTIKFIQFVRNKSTNTKCFEAKSLVTSLMLNNVAAVAFGLDSKCYENENSDFAQLAVDFFTPGGWTALVFGLATVIPHLLKIFHLRFITKKVEDKLVGIVSRTVKYREENNITRNDFLNGIIQLKKKCKEYEFTDLDLTAHAAAFFFDGYETSSQVISFIFFELAKNPDIQEKLRDEINSAFNEHDQKIPYEIIQTLPYLDAVVNETMRVHSPLLILQKMCTQNHTISLKNGQQSLTIEKGTPIILPVHGLHHDSKYYENPELFNPERFLGENKEKLTKGTYLPLGEGPRACLGQRYGILQIKVGISYIIQKYKLTVNKKTRLPLKYDQHNALTAAVGGLWLDFTELE